MCLLGSIYVRALSCVHVSSPAGQSFPIANYLATPVESPPSYSLITPGDSSSGVQLSFTNGVVSGKSTQLAMQFLCTVRYETNENSWDAHWRLAPLTTAAPPPLCAASSHFRSWLTDRSAASFLCLQADADVKYTAQRDSDRHW